MKKSIIIETFVYMLSNNEDCTSNEICELIGEVEESENGTLYKTPFAFDMADVIAINECDTEEDCIIRMPHDYFSINMPYKRALVLFKKSRYVES